MHKHDGAVAGEGEGPTACPQPSEHSAEGHDEMTRTERARGAAWRRCGCSWGWKEKPSQAGRTAEANCESWICLFMRLPPPPPDPHISLHYSQLQTSHGSQLPRPLKALPLTLPLISCVILGMLLPHPARVSSSVKQDDRCFCTPLIWCENLKKEQQPPCFWLQVTGKPKSTCFFNIKKHFLSPTH